MITKVSNRRIPSAVAIVLAAVAVLVVTFPGGVSSDTDAGEGGKDSRDSSQAASRGNAASRGGEGAVNKSDRAKRKIEGPKLTKASDPVIASVVSSIKDLEFNRTTFCREIEDDERILQEFVIDYPTPEEVEIIRDLISQVGGVTMDAEGTMMSWREKLLRQYLWPAEYGHCIVTTRFLKKSGKGDYTIIGVPVGQLIMREGNVPVSADGSFNFLESANVHSWTKPWRFSHLLQPESEADGS